jgi:hypothetical protein
MSPPALTPFWAALAIADEMASIMSGRLMPFSFSMYSKTESIS